MARSSRGGCVSLAVILCAATAGVFALAHPAQGQRTLRAEGLAAVVGGLAPGPGVDVLLQSDVELRVRLRLAGQAPTSSLPLGPLPPGLVRATLDELVGELLIAREATRVRIRPPSPADVLRERQHIEGEAGGADRVTELLRVLGVPSSEVDAMALRRAAVSAFLTANLEGTAEISDAEVERIYLAHDHPFADMTLEDAREPLRVWAAQAATQRAVARWVGVLRARTPFRIILRLPSGGAGAAPPARGAASSSG